MNSSGDFSIGNTAWSGTSKLIEEMGELQQVLGKLIGSRGETTHYDGSDLRQRLVEEMGDLRASLEFFIESNMSLKEAQDISVRSAKKLERFRKWHVESK